MAAGPDPRRGRPVARFGGMSSPHADHGFTLFETLIATGILVTAMAGIAQLFVLSIRFTRESAQFGVALVSAQDKLESLRALTYGFDEGGEPVTDGRLLPSPAASLSGNTGAYFDWLDESGAPVADADQASYVRRWKIAVLDDHLPEAVAIEVCVFKADSAETGPAGAEACLATLRARQP